MPADRRRGLPRQPFYYTIDQVAALLSLSEQRLRSSYLWLDGSDIGVYRARFLRAVDLSVGRRRKTTETTRLPGEWRVAEGELIRWLTYHRVWLYPEDAHGPYDPTASDYDDPTGPPPAVSDDEDLIIIEPYGEQHDKQ